MKKEHSTLIGEVLDSSNGWSLGERLLGAVFSPLIDPGLIIAKGLEELGYDIPDESDEDYPTCG